MAERTSEIYKALDSVDMMLPHVEAFSGIPQGDSEPFIQDVMNSPVLSEEFKAKLEVAIRRARWLSWTEGVKYATTKEVVRYATTKRVGLPSDIELAIQSVDRMTQNSNLSPQEVREMYKHPSTKIAFLRPGEGV